MKKRHLILGIVGLTIIFTIAIWGLPDEDAIRGDIGAEFDRLFQTYADSFSGTVLLAANKEIFMMKSYGFADFPKKIPLDKDSVFYLASVSKHITAVAILKLEDQGKLKTSDTLDKFFQNIPEDKKAITIHHLLTHTSGLMRMYGDTFEMVERDTAVRKTLATRLGSKPGEKFLYSNIGYNLLAAIVEKACGKKYIDFLKKDIFSPFGMTNTATVRDQTRWPIEQIAHAYQDENDKGTHLDWGMSWKRLGSGGIVTCVEDIYRFEVALLDGKVISYRAREKMQTPSLSNYGYGLHLQTTPKGYFRYSHSGGFEGFFTYLVVFPETKIILVILANKVNSEKLRSLIKQVNEKLESTAVILSSPYK